MVRINHRIHRRFGAALAAAPVAAALLAACSTPSSGTGSATGSPAGNGSHAPAVTAARSGIQRLLQAPTSIPVLPHLPSAPAKGKTIVFLNQPNVSAVVTEGQGVKAAAEALGWNYVSIDYDPSNPSTLQAAFTTALAKDPVAVALVGSSPSTYGASIISEYKARKIPIIASAVNPITPGRNGSVLGTLDNTELNTKLGGIGAQWAIADSGGTAHILLVHVSGFEPLVGYVKGFDSAIAACSGCKVTEADATLADVGNGSVSQLVVSKLRQDPSIKYVIYDEGDWAGGINSALSSAGISGVKIAGEDPGTPEMSALNASQQDAWAAHSMAMSGYFIVDQAARALAGIAPQPNVGDVPIQVLTPGNISHRTAFNAPADALNQFKKVWDVTS